LVDLNEQVFEGGQESGVIVKEGIQTNAQDLNCRVVIAQGKGQEGAQKDHTQPAPSDDQKTVSDGGG